MRRDSLNGSKELSGKSPLMVASIPWTSETGQQVPVFSSKDNEGYIPRCDRPGCVGRMAGSGKSCRSHSTTLNVLSWSEAAAISSPTVAASADEAPFDHPIQAPKSDHTYATRRRQPRRQAACASTMPEHWARRAVIWQPASLANVTGLPLAKSAVARSHGPDPCNTPPHPHRPGPLQFRR